MAVLSDHALTTQLQQSLAEDGLLDGAIVRLYTTNVFPTPGTPLSSYTAPTFTGYSHSAAVAWGAPFNIPNGKAVAGDRKQFTRTETGTPATIYGYILTTADSTPKVILAVELPSPVTLSNAGDAISIIPQFELKNAGV